MEVQKKVCIDLGTDSLRRVRIATLVDGAAGGVDRRGSLPSILETTSTEYFTAGAHETPSKNTALPNTQIRSVLSYQGSGRKRTNALAHAMASLPVTQDSDTALEVRESVPSALFLGHGARRWTAAKKSARFSSFLVMLVKCKAFSRAMLMIVLVNAGVLAVQFETDKSSETVHMVCDSLNDFFMVCYTAEFLLKFYAERSRYWLEVYNMFDFLILLVAYIDLSLQVLAVSSHDGRIRDLMVSLRSFRALKIVNFLPGVQMIATALINTLKCVLVDVVLLLLLLLFVFGIMGYYFFGYDSTSLGVLDAWGSLPRVFLSLFTIVTADSWWHFIETLTDEGMYSVAMSRTYIIAFLFIGHFITSNLFIAVIITNIQSSNNAFKLREIREREVIVEQRKNEYWRRSRREVESMVNKYDRDAECNFTELATEFYYAIQKRDFIIKSDLRTAELWLETVLKEMTGNVKDLRRSLFLHRDIVSQLGPVCNQSERDSRKVSVSQQNRYVLKLKNSMGLNSLNPSSPASSVNGRRASISSYLSRHTMFN